MAADSEHKSDIVAKHDTLIVLSVIVMALAIGIFAFAYFFCGKKGAGSQQARKANETDKPTKKPALRYFADEDYDPVSEFDWVHVKKSAVKDAIFTDNMRDCVNLLNENYFDKLEDVQLTVLDFKDDCVYYEFAGEDDGCKVTDGSGTTGGMIYYLNIYANILSCQNVLFVYSEAAGSHWPGYGTHSVINIWDYMTADVKHDFAPKLFRYLKMRDRLSEKDFERLIKILTEYFHKDFGTDTAKWLEWWEDHKAVF